MNHQRSLIPPHLDPSKNKQLHDQLLQSAQQKNSLNNDKPQLDIAIASHHSHHSHYGLKQYYVCDLLQDEHQSSSDYSDQERTEYMEQFIPPLNKTSVLAKFVNRKLDRMYKFPASYKQAMVHNIASKFGFKVAFIKSDENQQKELQDILKKKKPQQYEKYEKVPICPCCQNLIANVQIPLCYPTQHQKPKNKQPKFLLQTGVSMYFVLIKAIIVYLLLRFLVFDIPNILLSLNGHYCSSQFKKDECTLTTISGYNLNSIQDTKGLQIINILSLTFTILSIIYFIIYRKRQARLIACLHRNSKSQKDFSILIEDIPLFIYQKGMKKDQVRYEYEKLLKVKIQEKVRQWTNQILNQSQQKISDFNQIEQHFYKFVYKRKLDAEERKIQSPSQEQCRAKVKNLIVKKKNIVASISLCYDLTQLQTMNKIRDSLIQAYIKQNQDKIFDENSEQLKKMKKNDQLEHIPNQIDILNKQYTDLCSRLVLTQRSFRLSHFTGKAIVSFEYKHYRDFFLRQYDYDKNFLQMNGKSLRISLTNQPVDIYWYNMKVSDAERSGNIFYSYAILFMLLVLSFAALIGLKYWQTHTELPVNSKARIDQIKSKLFSVFMAILTNFINFILSHSIELLANVEKHKTKSDRLTSLIFKIIVTQTINTAFVYYIIWLITPSNPLGKAGLVQNVFDLVVVSGLISVVLQFLPLKYFVKKCINNYKYKDKEYINMFQVQLNEILQQPEFNFADMYAFYIVFTFVVSFYGFIAPAATPILICIFAIQFWVDKYNLFKRFSCPVDFGAELIKKIFIMFETSILLFVIGHLIWNLKINKDQSFLFRVISIANIVIATLFVTFELGAPDRLKKRIFPFQQDQCDSYSYTSYQKSHTFKKTFFRENPATSCLKQNLNQNNVRKHKKNKKLQEEEFPDPEFFLPDERIFNKFLKLEEIRKILSSQNNAYNALDEKYYEIMEDQDWGDQIKAEEICRQLQKEQRQKQEKKQNASEKSKGPSNKKN